MRSEAIDDILGSFLKIYSLVLALPILVGYYYSESLFSVSGFVIASLTSLFLGLILPSSENDPTVFEAMFATVLGWMLAVVLGSIPFLTELSMVDAIFESAAGLTTTGISIILAPENLSHSLLFWRGFSQWIGGLGILTFFIAIIRETGGVSRRLYSAEAHKTDSGSIRPSLKKSIIDLWKVYGIVTAVFILLYLVFGLSPFNSILHTFSGISSGGFSTQASSIGGFSTMIQIVTIPLMFLAGMNFVLIHKFLNADFSAVKRNAELRLYCKMFFVVASITTLELYLSEGLILKSILNGVFTTAAVISSTGYGTISLASLSIVLQIVFLAIMFVGGSLGSTSGGWKVFRLKAMMEALRTKLRSYRLPKSAINKPTIENQILEDSTIETISVLFFTWVSIIFVSTLAVLLADDTTFIGALSGAISAAGNMGPVYMSGQEMVGLSSISKLVWTFLMLAGRLEMLPLLAIFNTELFKHD